MQVSAFPHKATLASPDAVTQKKKHDYHLILFFINVALVVIGYGIANPTDFAYLVHMKLLRIAVLGISLVHLFNAKTHYQYVFRGRSSWVLWVFIALNIYILPFSANMFISFEKFVNLIPYFFYLNYFIIYLYRTYPKQDILHFLLKIIHITYLLPVLSFIFFGGSFDDKDIYGEVVGGFVSNHYGWGCTIFMATSFDLLRNKVIEKKYNKILVIGLCVIAFFILSISGSRSGYLAFVLCFLLFVLRNKTVSFVVKLLSTIAAFYFILHLYTDSNSALNKRLEKTETQLEKGDARRSIHDLGFTTMAENPETLVVGFGFYTFKEAMLNLRTNVDNKLLEISLHNSYYELLFGSGLFVFTFFMIFFVGKTFWNFGFHHSARYIFLIPIMLIPFFESNFNPGQFLFFPWFAIMFYYIHYSERQIKIEEIPQPFPVRKHQFL